MKNFALLLFMILFSCTQEDDNGSSIDSSMGTSQNLKVTKVTDFPSPCGTVTVPRQRFQIYWEKASEETIVSAEIRLIGNDTDATKIKTFKSPISEDSHYNEDFFMGCTYPPDAIEVKIIDSKGKQSEVYRVTY